MSEKLRGESSEDLGNNFNEKKKEMKELEERELQPIVNKSLPDSDELPKTLKTKTTGVNVDADPARSETSFGYPLDQVIKVSEEIKLLVEKFEKSLLRAKPGASASHQQHQFTQKRECSLLRYHRENREARMMRTLMNRSPRAAVIMAPSRRRRITARRQWLRNPLTMGDTILPGQPAGPLAYLSWP